MAAQKDPVLTKLDELEARYCELEQRIADPAVAGDSARLVELSKEQGKLRTIVEKYREYKKTIAGIEDAKKILNDGTVDEDFRTLAKEELGQLEGKRNSLLEQIRDALVMSDEMGVNSVIMEIRAGTGGEEAALFARDLFGMYLKYAQDRGWKVEQLHFSPAERGGFREVILSVKGEGVWSELGYEGGGHRVQRVPQTESQGRIHTSAATVAVLPEPEELDIQIAPGDVLEHVSRSSGPGGQSVNKLSSAVKLEHIPTAWRILRSRVYEYYESQKRAQRDRQRRTMIGSGDRSQKIRTYNYPQNRITDHRINLSLYSLDKIMTGDMTELIAALKNYDREQRLKNL
jgi:peptide chain release factor 1